MVWIRKRDYSKEIENGEEVDIDELFPDGFKITYSLRFRIVHFFLRLWDWMRGAA